jgi:hypothetical protein
MDHKSDVTIADFWGVDELLPQMDGQQGTSMIVCNTEKGQEMMKKAKEVLDTEPAVLDHDFMSRRNPNLVRPAAIYKDRARFEEEYARKGFLHVARRWGDLGIRYRLWLIKKTLKELIRR